MVINYQMIRTEDYFISLDQRCSLADEFNSDVVISLHCNAAANQAARGFDVFYYQPGGKGIALAEAIHESMLAAGLTAHAGPRAANFQVLRKTAAPAVLVEFGYMSNPADLQLLQEKQYMESACTAILAGLRKVYLSYGAINLTIDPGHGGHDNGAVYGVHEDSLNLQYGLCLAAMIEQHNEQYRRDEPDAEQQQQDLPPWTDFHSGEWGYSQAVQLYQAGAMLGYSDQTFRPDEPVTRRELAIVLSTLLNQRS
jgi:N-acetylmuramoyl-L-alanine amidase